MQFESWAGIATVLVAGVIMGSVLVPLKLVKKWAWENTWLVFAASAYLISPWLVAYLTIPNLAVVYENTGSTVVLVTCFLGFGWGFAVVLLGLAVDLVGLSISSALLYGASVALGSLGALCLIDPSRLFTIGGLRVCAFDLVLLVGVLSCAQAGRLRDPPATHDRVKARRGVTISLIAGVLSTLFNIVLAYGEPIRNNAIALGADPNLASNAIWSLAVSCGSLPSIAWAIRLLNRNSHWRLFRGEGSGKNISMSVGMGAAWIAGTVLYGVAASRLGRFGAAIGWPVYMSVIILVGIAWGCLLGEWKTAPRLSIRLLWAGVAVQILGIVLLSSAR
ncbi:MAG: L-rhamnose/proton symporter RhaT [Bryobacteraceae bacterium]|jgi:L-rhamnose-H+ transport protein